MTMEESSSSSSSWSWEQEKAFECALAVHFEDDGNEDVQWELITEGTWELITEAVPGKTVEEVRHHYELLVEDVSDIESGLVPLLSYASSSEDGGGHGHGKKCGGTGSSHGGDSWGGGKGSKTEQERRKGIAWTEDEHRLFLLGLDKYGKGDWRSISRNFVISRTPTQVASHAQKYFIRLNSMNKDRRRASIHDITSVGDNADTSAVQGPITGQTNATVDSSPQPPLVPAVGIPAPGGPHVAYGVRAPLPGPVVNGAPMNLSPMAYPMHHASAHNRSRGV